MVEREGGVKVINREIYGFVSVQYLKYILYYLYIYEKEKKDVNNK